MYRYWNGCFPGGALRPRVHHLEVTFHPPVLSKAPGHAQTKPVQPSLNCGCCFVVHAAGRRMDKAGDGPSDCHGPQVRPAVACGEGPLQMHPRQARARVAAALLRRRQQIAGKVFNGMYTVL